MVFVRGIRNYTQLHAVFGPPNYTQITRTMLAVFAPEMPPRHPKSHTRSRSRSLPGCFALVGYGPDQGREPENLELRSGRVWRVGGFIRAWGSGIGGEECRGGLAPGHDERSRSGLRSIQTVTGTSGDSPASPSPSHSNTRSPGWRDERMGGTRFKVYCRQQNRAVNLRVFPVGRTGAPAFSGIGVRKSLRQCMVVPFGSSRPRPSPPAPTWPLPGIIGGAHPEGSGGREPPRGIITIH